MHVRCSSAPRRGGPRSTLRWLAANRWRGGSASAATSLIASGAPEEVTSERERRAGAMDLRLRACPFKDAVLAEGGHLICALHRGLVRGALEQIDAGAELAVFEPKDPVTAGCRVLVTGLGRRDDGGEGAAPPGLRTSSPG